MILQDNLNLIKITDSKPLKNKIDQPVKNKQESYEKFVVMFSVDYTTEILLEYSCH